MTCKLYILKREKGLQCGEGSMKRGLEKKDKGSRIILLGGEYQNESLDM